MSICSLLSTLVKRSVLLLRLKGDFTAAVAAPSAALAGFSNKMFGI